ncbi:MAG: MBL fold metallo-hydrolase [Desulfobacterales bacterium CG07_land_8_20_14_0_80_52_14]|nr:MAG: MBL fold metallo-hydrolase [Desulfobacterales bacterium CG23_combo_of_CG06-09_8_20_14_all_52_9]PIU50591.1 MAG: MBL fold metallo-hydrolase [Desulfobacterales bacterium CG07_land_8_20_14_0_80_52_14]
MQIKCWGSRGSIPVSGYEYLKYGGDTTCLEVRTQSDHILIIDAGTGIRKLGNSLIQENRFEYHLIFTHCHWDHILGFPFFKPTLFKNARLVFHNGSFHKNYARHVLSRVMYPPNFPLKSSDIDAEILFQKDPPGTFEIGSITLTPIALSHPDTGFGYKIVENGKTFVFLTDNELGHVHPYGLSYPDYRTFSEGADILFHDAEYTPEEYQTTIRWGHSCYRDALNLALEAGVGKLGLFHLNQDRTDADMDRIVEDCRNEITKNGPALEVLAVGCDTQFDL